MSPALIVAEARGWIGTPYRHQASLKGVGCDCLGLVRGVWRAVLGAEPEAPGPYPADPADPGDDGLEAAARRHLVPVAGAFAAGNVLLFRWRDGRPARHCAVATGPDAMVHAHAGAAVAEVAIRPWWSRHHVASFRFPKGAP